jgi:acyl-coenzyme A synthetase/AMP-(fatty) acid ligase
MHDTSAMVPLFPGFRPGATVAWRRGEPVSHEAFLAQAISVAEELPDSPLFVNLCDERYLFMLGLCAAMVRGATTLLPANRMPNTVNELTARYARAVCLGDSPFPGLDAPLHPLGVSRAGSAPSAAVPMVPKQWDAIVAFTSGSTGIPRPHPKRWGDLMLGATLAACRFGMSPQATIVATVPSQHMYGLELSVLIPLATGLAAASERPFFPEDVARALARVPAPRILVSTPVHLSACVRADVRWPEIALAISATAPLSRGLARQVEERMDTRVHEIYGCTEAGSIASRRTLQDPAWRWYDTIRARRVGDATEIRGDYLPEPVVLSDLLELDGEGRFQLLGRASDMLNIAGKRASLGDLNLKLVGIEGVVDGVLVAQDEREGVVSRLAAVVVAPTLSEGDLVRALRRLLDPAFVPRRILLVDRLPRNEAGKLPREWLLTMLGKGGRA